VRLTVVLAAIVMLLWASRSAAAASPSFELARARSEYDQNEFQKVIDTLGPELYPHSKIRNEEELKEAHRLLGSAHLLLDHQDSARQEFTALLFLDPSYELDSATETPRVYAFFQTLKSELREKLNEINRQKEKELAARNQPSKEIVITRVIHDPAPPITNYIPFGYGQFRNGQTGKGVFLLVAESLTLGASAGIMAYQIATYGLPSRYSTPDDADLITKLHTVQIISGVAGIGLYVYGVIDAFANKPQPVEETRTERQITPARPTSLHILPIVTPSVVGAGVNWSF
jgi:hypothetical protein